MDAFEIRRRLIGSFQRFTESFVEPADLHIREFLEDGSAQGRQWPALWISRSPSFATGGSVGDLVAEGLLHPAAAGVFRVKMGPDDPGTDPIVFHAYQRAAIQTAATGKPNAVLAGLRRRRIGADPHRGGLRRLVCRPAPAAAVLYPPGRRRPVPRYGWSGHATRTSCPG